MGKTPLLTFRCPQDLIDSIHKQMAQTGLNKTEIAVSRLKESVPSLPIMERAKLPKIPAIYFVITAYNKLLYVGRTENLFNRWGNHRRYQQFIETDSQSRIAWFEIEENNLESMPIVEAELITLLDSEYNNSEVVNGRFKATINIERKTWEKFKLWAKSKGSNASEQITQFVYSCLDGFEPKKISTSEQTLLNQKQQEELWQLAQAKIEQSISELKDYVHDYVHAYTDGAIASAVKIVGEYTDERIEFSRQRGELSNLSFGTDDTDKDGRLPDTEGTKDTDDDSNFPDADNPDDTDEDLQFPDTDDTNKKTYSDSEVGELEGKTRQSINRYRTGRSKNPDKSFYDRWEAISGVKAWRKKTY